MQQGLGDIVKYWTFAHCWVAVSAGSNDPGKTVWYEGGGISVQVVCGMFCTMP